eukprot:g1099.t1
MSSFFRKILGSSSSSAEKATTRNPATAKTIDTIDALTQKEQHLEKRREVLEKRIEQELENAKRYSREKKKSQALLALKKKKMFEKNIEDIGNLIMKVNEQKIMLENAQTTAETIKALTGATKATKAVMKENDIEDVDKVMEEIQDGADHMREVNERLAEPTGVMADYDEDELLAELEGMDAELLDEELLAPAKVPETALPSDPFTTETLPSVPANAVKAKPTKAKTKEEQELEDLYAELV